MIQIKNKIGDKVEVPCGKCPLCVRRRVSQWSFRLIQEEKVSHSAYFLTLTYDTGKVPLSRNGCMSLSKRDLQLFFKRLRKARADRYRKRGIKPLSTLRYYAVGEYGGHRGRPHYHVLLFNCELELINKAWTTDRKIQMAYGTKPIKVPIARKAIGNVFFGKVTSASVGYCLKYMNKHHGKSLPWWNDRAKEFTVMSQGLGRSYLTPQMIRWHLSDVENRMYCSLPGDRKVSMPRYYKDKIYDEYYRDVAKRAQLERLLEKQAKQMQEEGEAYYHNQYQKMIADCRKTKSQFLSTTKLS